MSCECSYSTIVVLMANDNYFVKELTI